MTRGVKLDRWKRYEVQHDSGSPSSSTKGNIYVDDVSGNLYTRRKNQLAFDLVASDSFWEVGGIEANTLNPLVQENGLRFDCSNPINLKTTSDVSLYGASVVLGTTTNGTIDLLTTGVNGDINIDTTSSNGDINIDTSSSGSGDINLITQSGSGKINISTSGSADGTVSIVTGGVSSLFSVYGSESCINGYGGVLLTNMHEDSDFGSITNFYEYSTNTVVYVSGTHSLYPNDTVTISDTSNYNGQHIVLQVLSSTQFVIDTSYSIDETGTWTVDRTIGDDGPAFIKIGDQSGYDPLHIYSAHSDILLETKAASCSTDIRLESADDIIMNATGEVNIDCAFDSYFTLTADSSSDQELLVSVSNAGTGDSTLTLSSNKGTTLSAGSTLTLSAGVSVEYSTPTVNINPSVLNLDPGEINIDCASDSYFTLTADSSSDRELLVSISNAGTGGANLALTSNKTIEIGAGSTLSLSAGSSVEYSTPTVNLDPGTLNISPGTLNISGTPGVSFSGAVSNITVVKGIVTAVS